MSVRQRRRVGRRLPGRDPTGLALSLCIGASIYAALRLGPGDRAWPVVAAGIVLIVLGVALRAWSIATLGRFFQYQIEVQADHRVVTDGPYRWVRHPAYSGLALVLLGIGVATGDVLSIAVIAVLAGVGLAIRVRAEERQLTDALGDQYTRFAAQRKRLVPGVW